MSRRTDLDLGEGVTLRFTGLYGVEPPPDFPHFGAIVTFSAGQPDECEGAITFDHPITRQKLPDSPKWEVRSWEPLTLSPSAACTAHPAHHGWA